MTETSATQAETSAARPPLTLEQWAAVFAHSCHYPPEELEGALASLDVAPAEWEEANRRWPAELTRALGREDPSIGEAFNTAFLPVKRRLKEERPATSDLEPLRPPIAPKASLPEMAIAPPPSPEPEPPPAAPSLPPPPMRLEPELAMPSFVAPAAESPWIAAGTPPPAMFVAAPRAEGAPAWTAPAVAERSFDHPAFAGEPEPTVDADPDPGALVVTKVRHFKDLGSTASVAESPLAAVLPFGSPAVAVPRPRLRSEPAAPGPPKIRAVVDLGSTVTAADSPIPAALPFHAPRPNGNPPAFGPPPPLADPQRGADLPSLSVEQYASLCVELEIAPGRAAGTWSRYKISPNHHAALEAHWRDRLAHAETWQAFSSAYVRYKAWILQQQKP